jgi:hypothetical protein
MSRSRLIADIPGYETLAVALDAALLQAAAGKGAERHADGQPFERQPMSAELQAQGHPGFAIGQARKKLLESLRLPPERAAAECLGAIVYAAAAWWYYQTPRAREPKA